MTAINKVRERKLLKAAEKALREVGYLVRRRRFKHYTIEKDGVRQNIAVRTSANRWLGFAYRPQGWLTLGDAAIDGFVIATFDDAEQPSAIIVYPVIPRAQLEPRFVEARTAYIEGGINVRDPRVWVCLDRRITGRVWDAGSGVVESLAPIARYPLDAEPEPDPEVRVDTIAEASVDPIDGPLPRSSISMVVDLDDEEHRYLAERYARRLEVDPRRLLIEVRLTFLS